MDTNLLETSTKRLQLRAELPGKITGGACKIKTTVLNVDMQYAGEQQFLLFYSMHIRFGNICKNSLLSELVLPASLDAFLIVN